MKRLLQIPAGISSTSSSTSAASGPRARLRAVGGGLLNFVAVGLLVAGAWTLTGCGDKGSKGPALNPEDVKPVDVTASAEAQQNQRMKMMAAIRDGVMPPEPALKLRGGELATPEVLAAYNQLLLRAMVQRREPPETTQELQRWPLPRLPSPPPGKRVVYDPALCIVRLDPP